MPELVFKGKEFVYNHHLTVPYSPILRHPDKSIGSGTLDDNLIVHGDNLLALKALMPRYAGKVDCIFIDPPYNTGNEGWSYNDNVNSPIMREWLTHNPVNAEDMLRHDKWCCMMWPRLRLLYELLAETGSLWMTIDGTEYARARLMLDELFGEGGPGNQANHVATIAWQKRTAPDARVMIDDAFDFLVGYAKSRPDLILYRRPVTDQDRTRFSNPDDDPHGPWASTDLSAQGYRPNQMYSILLPGGREITPPEGRCWSVVEEEYQRLLRDGRVWFGVNGDTGPRVKTYLEESDGFTDWTWWPYGEVGSNETAKKELMAIFGGKSVFETPKPVGVISRLLQLTTDRSALILDSFAGSGTTAHAVLAANERDGGDRRFILVECEDYADTVTAERVRRVITGYPYKGTQREALLERKVTWTQVQKGSALADEARACAEMHREAYDEIKTEVKNGALTVTGIRNVAERAPGIGGSFTYCTLGVPMDEGKLLSGGSLPSWEALADYQFYTATGRSRPSDGPARIPGTLMEWYAGRADDYHVWVVYRPDLEYLRSREPTLTLNMARDIAGAFPGEPHLVCAPSRFVPNRMLLPLGVEFAPLPYSLYRIEKD